MEYWLKRLTWYLFSSDEGEPRYLSENAEAGRDMKVKLLYVVLRSLTDLTCLTVTWEKPIYTVWAESFSCSACSHYKTQNQKKSIKL